MNVIRKIMMGLGGVVVVALVLALALPKTVHAIVSTLVTVSNTPANPVSTLAADAATAFVAEGTCSLFTGVFSNDCHVSLIYTVPSGQIAVIDSLTGYCQLSSGSGEEAVVFLLSYNSPSGSAVQTFIAPNPVFQFPGGQASTGGQNLRTYAGAGAISVDGFTGNAELSATDSCSFTLSGHLVTP